MIAVMADASGRGCHHQNNARICGLATTLRAAGMHAAVKSVCLSDPCPAAKQNASIGELDPLQPRSLPPHIVKIVSLVIIVALPGAQRSLAAEQALDVPAWLRAHVGYGDGQIAPVVLERARALYLQKTRDGPVSNPCYFAMDATRPHVLGNAGRRFYVICEADRSFRAISSGHGGGRHLKGIANFANGKRCAKNFGNSMYSLLTTGGAYITREEIASFKGYYRASGKDAPLVRSFVQFDGEGDTANARPREIGGHAAVLLRGVCRRKKPGSPHADVDGYVPFGRLEDYTDGRSSGCTSWSRSDAENVIAMTRGKPTTLYIYPERSDIDAVAQAVKGGRSPSSAGLHWNASCLREIRSPKFWPKETLEPTLIKIEKARPPAPPPRPAPICKGR